jgi:hypothetical protein
MMGMGASKRPIGILKPLGKSDMGSESNSRGGIVCFV